MTRERDRIQENTNKYIVRNCPAYIHRPLNNHNMVCLLQNELRPEHKNLYVYCQEIDDCVMKQIVEKCKDIKKDHYWGMREIRFSQEILELLDIEEVE